MNQPRTVVPFPRPTAVRHAEELGFMPAALEILEKPPSPTGRAIMLTIVILAAIALVWASLSSIDIIATAPGKIVPSGRSKIIQPFEIGIVRAIHVQDGQRVKAGDLLIELDPTMEVADRQHVRGDLVAAQLEEARLRAALADTSLPLDAFHPPADAPPELVASQRQYLLDQVAEQTSKLAALDRQQVQKEAERSTAIATMGKLSALIPLLQQQVDMRKILFDHQTGSKLVYIQTLQALVEQQQDLIVAKSKYHESVAAAAATVEVRRETIEEYRRMRLDELTKAENKVAGLTQDAVRAEQRTKQQSLVAPVDGVVQQLAVHTVGGIVTPAEPLLVLVPEGSHLEISARVSNHDIGFVHPGQLADIKVDTFPYTKYGLLHGTVESISADAVTSDDRPDKANVKTTTSDGDDANAKEPVYEAHVSLGRTKMRVDDEVVTLSPGMAVTVEVRTGSRRIISYLLSPLLRYGHESLRER